MTTAVATHEKLLVYDGDCPMCIATVNKLLRLGLVRPEQAKANHQLDPELFERAYATGMKNELVVLEPQTGEARKGTDGLLWIIGENTGQHPLVRLAGLPGVRQIIRFGYQAISFNRRIITPPKSQIVCDCEPEVTIYRRLTLLFPLAVVILAVSATCGAALSLGLGRSTPLAGAICGMVAACGGAALVSLAAAVCLPAGKRLDFASHQVAILFVGVLPLIPCTLVAPWAPPMVVLCVAAVAVATGFWLMFRMQCRRLAFQKLSWSWLGVWLAALVVAQGAALLLGARLAP